MVHIHGVTSYLQTWRLQDVLKLTFLTGVKAVVCTDGCTEGFAEGAYRTKLFSMLPAVCTWSVPVLIVILLAFRTVQ